MTKEEFKTFVHKTIGAAFVAGERDFAVEMIADQWENDIDDAFTRGQHSVYESGEVNWA